MNSLENNLKILNEDLTNFKNGDINNKFEIENFVKLKLGLTEERDSLKKEYF